MDGVKKHYLFYIQKTESPLGLEGVEEGTQKFLIRLEDGREIDLEALNLVDKQLAWDILWQSFSACQMIIQNLDQKANNIAKRVSDMETKIIDLKHQVSVLKVTT